MLAQGDMLPGFPLLDAEGKQCSLEEFRGRRIVLYFYPKDDTPGCTTEACGFRDQKAGFDGAGAIVVGVSADKPASHAKFAAKFGLPFLLLSDPEHAFLEACAVWVEKKMYGKTFMGIIRSTFLIDATGRVEQVWPKVKPEGHAEEVLAFLMEGRPPQP
jgi:peroxiredoxin Q/BCP